jgi:hypothetical protein
MAGNYSLSGDLYGRTRRTGRRVTGVESGSLSGSVQEPKTTKFGGFNPDLGPQKRPFLVRSVQKLFRRNASAIPSV